MECYEKYFHCTKDSFEFELCSRCLEEENFPTGILPTDFEKENCPAQVFLLFIAKKII